MVWLHAGLGVAASERLAREPQAGSSTLSTRGHAIVDARAEESTSPPTEVHSVPI